MAGIAVAAEHGVAVQGVDVAPELTVYRGDVRIGTEIPVAGRTVGAAVPGDGAGVVEGEKRALVPLLAVDEVQRQPPEMGVAAGGPPRWSSRLWKPAHSACTSSR